MGVVWCRELPRERDQSGKYQEGYVYTRSWLIRVDDHNTPLPDITNAPGFHWKDPHPDDSSCKAMEFDTKVKDDVGLLYTVTIKYYTPPVDGGDSEQPEGLEGFMKSPIWTGGSSNKTIPALDKDKNIICNSAGDPLEGLEMEICEPRLSLKNYYHNHTQLLSDQRYYSDTTNDAEWNGGAAETWRCLGCSFQPVTENVAGVSYTGWEVNWEFAYDRFTWRLKPWDVGFAERCDSSGSASGSGTQRKAILGQDKKPVRQPVALAGGVALPAGSPPQIVNAPDGVQIYLTRNFTSGFGQVFTPLTAS